MRENSRNFFSNTLLVLNDLVHQLGFKFKWSMSSQESDGHL